MENPTDDKRIVTDSPSVLDGFVKPGFTAKVYTCLFFKECMVFCKTGSFGPNSSGTMSTALAGNIGDSLLLGAIGSIIDSFTNRKRVNKAAELLSLSPEEIAKSNKRNVLVKYSDVKRVEIKGPNFAGELRIRIHTSDNLIKYRLDKQSESLANYTRELFSKFTTIE
jgi:hypothetical protein